MGLPKKGSRKIVIDDIAYRYIITGNDGSIDLTIELEDGHGQRFITTFDYHHLEKERATESGEIIISLTQRNQITPNVVRQTIQYGIENGWKPGQKGKEIRMNFIDDKIKLNLNHKLE